MNIAHELWRTAGWTMLHFLWIGTLVGLLAGACRVAVRHAPTSIRYASALFCFSLLAAAPLVIAVMIFEHSLLQGPSTSTPPAAFSVGNVQSDGGVYAFDFGFPAVAGAEYGAEAASPTANEIATTGWISALPTGLRQLVGAVEPLAVWICSWLPWIWICGSPLVLCLLASGVIGADRLRRNAELLTAHPIVACCCDCAVKLGIRRPVLVGVSERISSPLLLGILRPMILLPPAVLGECSTEQIEMILWHELAHVRRWDNLVNLLQRLVEALLFFHPAVWRVSAWVRLEREHCCDAVVLRHVANPQAYAETLASLAMPELSPRLATASLANHQLVSRIRHILNLEDRAMKVSHKLAAVLSVGIIAGGVITFSLAQSPNRPAPTTAPPAASAGFVFGFPTDEPATASGPTPSAPATINPGSAIIGNVAPVAGGAPSAAPATVAGGPPANSGLRVVVPAISNNNNSNLAGDMLITTTQAHTGSMMLGLATTQPAAAAWSAAQATGAPNTHEPGDHGTAWASATPDSQIEWLQVEFAEPAQCVAVLVHETFNPGAVSAVQACAENGRVLAVWHGVDPVGRDNKSGLAIIPLATSEKVQKLIITIDSATVAGWNEIDAVGILDSYGATHWATSATASSSFAVTTVNGRMISTLPLGRQGLRLAYDADSGATRIGQLEQQMQQLQKSLDEIKSLLKSQAGPAAGAGTPALPPGTGTQLNLNGSGDTVLGVPLEGVTGTISIGFDERAVGAGISTGVPATSTTAPATPALDPNVRGGSGSPTPPTGGAGSSTAPPSGSGAATPGPIPGIPEPLKALFTPGTAAGVPTPPATSDSTPRR